MLEYQQNQSARIPIRLFNTQGTSVSGILANAVAVTLEKADGTILQVTIDGVNNLWTEVTTGAFASQGKYDLIIAGSFTNVLGPLVLAVSGGGGNGMALVQVVATAGDTTPPSVLNYTPAPGTTIGPNTPIAFDVIDLTNPIRLTLIAVLYSATGQTDLVYDGSSFRGDYTTYSTVTPITNGNRFSIRKRSNWPSTPTFEIYTVDVTGNEG